MDVTLASVLDIQHYEEWLLTSPLIRKFCPKVPWVVVVDVSQRSLSEWRILLAQFEVSVYPSITPAAWPQRERMLSEFCLNIPHLVRTKWFFKADADAFPTKPCNLIEKEWVRDDPVLCSSKWMYSKPSNVIEKLDDWGDTVDELKHFPRLDLPYDPANKHVSHARIISYAYLGLTEWHRWASRLFKGRLPFPSQDTCHFYIAKRTNALWRHVYFKKMGWRHVGNGGERLKRAVVEALR